MCSYCGCQAIGSFSQLRSHIDKEENGLFPAAAIELDGPDWVQVDHLTPSPEPH